jgi:alpha-tubulin suppressor-like RCC1 family protein
MSFAPTQSRAHARRLAVLSLVSLAVACGDPTGSNGDPDGPDGGGETLGPPVTAGMASVSGEQAACGVTVAGKAYCWGGAFARTVAPVSEPNFNSWSPRAVAEGMVFASISTAPQSSCALTLDGTPYCWGLNSAAGQLGSGSTVLEVVYSPGLVAGGHKFAQLRHNGGNTFALTSAGKLYAWGANSGTLGDGTTIDRPTPVAIAPSQSFSAVASTGGVTIAIDTGGVAWTWGTSWSTMGLSNATAPTVLAIAGVRRFRTVAVSTWTLLLVTTAGEVFAAGLNPTTGQNHTGLVAVAPGLVITKVSTAFRSHLALTADGRLYAWGNNEWGQVGDGTTTQRATPVAIGGALRFRDIAAHQEFSSALGTNGELYFWGRNADGIFGNGVARADAITPFSAVPLGPQARGLALLISPASATLNAGETIDLSLTVLRIGGGFATSGLNIGRPGAVTISVRDLPAGVSASFPNGATISPDQLGTTLRLSGSSGMSGGVGNFGIRAQASNMPTQPVQPMSVLKVNSSGGTGLSLACTSGSTPSSFPAGYHCMTNSSGLHVPGKFAVPTLTSSPWWVDDVADVCVSWRSDSNLGRSTARFKAGLGGGATTVTEGHWGMLVGSAGLPEGVAGARYLFTSNLDAQTQLLTFNDSGSGDVINNYDFRPSATCPW